MSLTPEMFRAAAKELEEIVGGAVKHKTKVTSELAGHWAGRVLAAAFAANETTPPEGSVVPGKLIDSAVETIRECDE